MRMFSTTWPALACVWFETKPPARFDSADILPEAKPSLDELGKALTDPKLTGGTFLIAGHTDAKGSDEYNLALS